MKTIFYSEAFWATVFVILAYLAAGYVCRSPGKNRCWLSPLQIAAGNDRVASLSTLQILFFTMIVLWLSIFWCIKEGKFFDINTDIALLLGVSLAGSTVGKITDKTRSRLTQENFSWLKRKGWINEDLMKGRRDDRKPKWSELIATNGKLDMARFQAVGFSLVVGITLFLEGVKATSTNGGIDIPEAYLALIGISQGAYVGGKFTKKDIFQQLNNKLDGVRAAELKFKKTLVASRNWSDEAKSLEVDKLFALARDTAPEEYIEFEHVAEEASNFVTEMTGKEIDKSKIRPSMPT